MKRIIVIIAAVLLLGLAAGCAQAAPTPTATAKPAAPAAATATTAPAPTATRPPATPTPKPLEKVRLRLDWFPFGYHAPIVLGFDKGFYKEAGVDLDILGGGGEVLATTFASEGRADVVAVTGPENILLGLQQGLKIKFYASLFPKGSSGLMCRKDANINTPKDLEGKTISRSSNMTVDKLLPLLIKRNNVNASKISYMEVAPAIKNTLVLEGKAACVGVPIWTAGMLEKFGGSTEILFADFGLKAPGWGIAANTDFAKQKPQALTDFIAATIRSYDYARTHQEEAIEAINKRYPAETKDKEMHAAVLKYVYKYYDAPAAGWKRGQMNMQDWQDIYSALREIGDITKDLNLADAFTNDLLPK